eukprot:TRINITY_DN92839_c0_g1_i5.p1 TRINITY_DN92839_c0_g1~~TRINITY_DN92839_c0_g1_i5.p1  ORF type:complete len:305 (-),score=34.40 TRINITY_DN92839_c0_g1_i5:66-980(-)
MNHITKFASREVDGFVIPIEDLVVLPLLEYVLDKARKQNNPSAEPLPPLLPVVLFAGSSSEGADAILSQNFTSMSQLKGRDIHLEEGTISQYILYRALQLYNLTLDDVNLVNTPLFDQVPLYVQGEIESLVSWSPFIPMAQESVGGNVLFTTKEISREIVDVMVVHSEVLREHPGLGRALTAAFYEIMDLMASDTIGEEAIEWMANRYNSTPAEFRADMEVIQLFYKPTECVQYLHGNALKRTLANALNYAFDLGLLDQVFSSPTDMGIDIMGNVYGSRDNIKLIFEDIFCVSEVQKRRGSRKL